MKFRILVQLGALASVGMSLLASACASAPTPDADQRVFDWPYKQVWQTAYSELPSIWGVPIERADPERGEIIFRTKSVTNDYIRSTTHGAPALDPTETYGGQVIRVERIDEALSVYFSREGENKTRVQINLVTSGRHTLEPTENPDETERLRIARRVLDGLERALRKK